MNIYMDSSFSGAVHALCFLSMEETVYILFYVFMNLSAVFINQDDALDFNAKCLLSIKLTNHLFSGCPDTFSLLHEAQLSGSVLLCIRVRKRNYVDAAGNRLFSTPV